MVTTDNHSPRKRFNYLGLEYAHTIPTEKTSLWVILGKIGHIFLFSEFFVSFSKSKVPNDPKLIILFFQLFKHIMFRIYRSMNWEAI